MVSVKGRQIYSDWVYHLQCKSNTCRKEKSGFKETSNKVNLTFYCVYVNAFSFKCQLVFTLKWISDVAKLTWRSTSSDVYVQDPNHMLQICSSKGKFVASIAHDERNMEWGYHVIPPSALTTASASRSSMSVSALYAKWIENRIVD